MTDDKKTKSIWSWKISDEELKNQVENYLTLPFTSSARGIAIIFVLCLLGLSVVLALFRVIPLDISSIIEWFIYAVALFFIYKGHRWAIILVMLLWTGDKVYQLYEMIKAEQGSFIAIIIWWFIVMPYLYKALRVENRRKKTLAPVVIKDSVGYCNQCGTQTQKQGSKFCSKCGAIV